MELALESQRSGLHRAGHQVYPLILMLYSCLTRLCYLAPVCLPGPGPDRIPFGCNL